MGLGPLPFGFTELGCGLSIWFGFWYFVYRAWEKITRKKVDVYDPENRRLAFAIIVGIIALPVCMIVLPLIVQQIEIPNNNPYYNYTPPPGKKVIHVCSPGDISCDQPEYYKDTNDWDIKLWTTTYMTESKFERSTKAQGCIATESKTSNDKVFWYLNCGIHYSKEIPIEGWVPEHNIIFP